MSNAAVTAPRRKFYAETGGEIWADIVSPVAHVGRQVFSGSYMEFPQATGRVGAASADAPA